MSAPLPFVNLADVEFNDVEDNGYYTSRRAQFSAGIGARRLGYNLTDLPPGKAQCPFHSHRVEEEMFFILEGEGELRFGHRRHQIRRFDVIACPTGGPEVAHQIVNTGSTRLRYLAVSNNADTEICEYPDSGKVGIYSAEPGAPRLRELYRAETGVDYYDRESTGAQPPAAEQTASAGPPLAGLALREAVPADALCLSVLAMQVFLDTYATAGIRPAIAREVLACYSQAAFGQAIAHPAHRILIAEHDSHLVGFAQLTLDARHDLAPAGRQAELLRLYVQEPFTGAKVGSRLLAEAESVAAAAGTAVLWSTPWVHNHRALAFYARRGYHDCGPTCFRLEGESHENRVLAKLLAADAAA